eukprot:TRINITY_DN717_c0_g1_i5.p1 TRINITY_DN717_c0_g1~~TRINITY_DN717_c0_g1_i5.p1  ORF type:complete len:310 (-),score=49.89 TRINITY_DN717_c0_g1_i5:259-1188(-)
MSTQVTINKSEDSNIFLHPLVIISISDHFTRTKFAINNKDPNPRVVGALIGTQAGRNIEIFRSFEAFLIPGPGGRQLIDKSYLLKKSTQLKEVHPSYDFLGWYSTGDGAKDDDLEIQKQLLDINENPLYLIINPLSQTTTLGSSSRELPISIYESGYQLINDEPRLLFSKVTYKIETTDAERISVDYVANATISGGDENSSLNSHLKGMHNAVKMLNMRVKILSSYLQAVSDGKVPADHALLRQVASLINLLPAFDSARFRQDLLHEYNDVLLVTYLSALTKSVSLTSDLVDKFNVAYDKLGMRRRFFH